MGGFGENGMSLKDILYLVEFRICSLKDLEFLNLGGLYSRK